MHFQWAERAILGESIAGPFITCIKDGTVVIRSSIVNCWVGELMSQVVAPNRGAKQEAEEMILEDTHF